MKKVEFQNNQMEAFLKVSKKFSEKSGRTELRLGIGFSPSSMNSSQ
jgi:hypothetical protein